MRCAACGSIAAADARFCAQCGSPLTDGLGAPDPAMPVRPPMDVPAAAADRRVVTALFADLVDYVRMLAEHDPEVVRARVTAALATMADAVARFDGTREKFIGDALFAVFGWPRGHDDDAVRAGLAALAIRAGLQEIGDGAEPMEVRIGLATGEVVASRPDAAHPGDLGLTGEAITTAARIQSLARPGEILLDEATHRAARGRLAADPHGSVVLRGQSTAVGLMTLRGEAGMGAWTPHRAPTPDPIVGRDAEMATLRAILDEAARTGRGAIAVVTGDAGVGKTRLLTAMETDARERGMAWTWTENVSYGRTEPYRFARLFAQTVADEFGTDSGSLARQILFTDDLSPADQRRYGGAIAAIAREAAFGGWEDESGDIPADPREIAATLLEVAVRYIERLMTSVGPRVVVIDDLHWLDPSSVGMVELLAEVTDRHPLVLLAGVRPGSSPSWTDRPGITRIDLQGLDEPETARLATLVARAALEADGARSIHARTGGNPLFIGETVRAYLEDGTLEWRDGRVALIESRASRVPITLRAILGARIDALDPEARDVLGVASIVGIRFSRDTVGQLQGGPEPAPATFERLVEAALIAPEDGDWRFAHPLVHSVAYAGLLASVRRVLHARFADALEARPTGASLTAIAEHRAAAGDVARALPLLREAAGSAMALGAAAEAAALWRQAADLGATTDPSGASRDRAMAEGAMRALRDVREAQSAAPASTSAVAGAAGDTVIVKPSTATPTQGPAVRQRASRSGRKAGP